MKTHISSAYVGVLSSICYSSTALNCVFISIPVRTIIPYGVSLCSSSAFMCNLRRVSFWTKVPSPRE